MLDKLKDALVSTINRAAYGKAPEGGPVSVKALSLRKLDGSPMPVDDLGGKVVLFVNVASRCGLTPQYEQLEQLYRRFQDKGFLIVGAPCNQFLGQEPGSSEQIATFCSVTYGVTFPLLEKAEVNGKNRAPLYRWLIGSPAGKGEDISWNFEKFLVSRDGKVIARFDPQTKPEDPKLVSAVESALR